MAYPFLPINWTGLGAPALLIPDISILPGDEPIPLPSFDTFVPQHKRALQFLPLLVGLSIISALAATFMPGDPACPLLASIGTRHVVVPSLGWWSWVL